ncbi:MAG: hypothetical protein FWC98_00800 [Bacteroidales bacterium]|nr:hypothetical protein [Bacteroidales bacterium]
MISLKNNDFKNLSLSELGLWLLIPFASLTNVMWIPISPTMILFLGAVVCWIFQNFNNQNSKFKIQNFKAIIAVCLTFSFYLFASQYLMDAPFRRYIAAVMAPLFLVFILIFSEQTSEDFLKKLGRKFILYSVIIFSFEAVFRYAMNFWTIYQGTNPEHTFYQFKINAFIHNCSNMVAILLVLLLFFMLWWKDTYKESLKKEIAIISILIVLAISRAAIPAVVVGLFYYFFFKNADWKKSLLVFFSMGVFGVFVLWVLRYFPDYSFQTKFLILEETLIYFQTASLNQILFGLGFTLSGDIMTFGAHNYFLVYLMESGVIGFLLVCATLFVFVKASNGKVMIVLLPFIVQNMAASSSFLPYFYVIMAFIIIMNKPLLENRIH